MDLIYRHNIGKGINILEGFGRADPDDPDIRKQMLEKHPAPAATDSHADDWPELPEHWCDIAQELVSSDAMHEHIANVIRETDPITGVGPRGLHYNYLNVLFTGHMSSLESKAAQHRLGDLAARYLSCGLPAYARRLLGGGLLTPVVKKEPVPGCTPDQGSLQCSEVTANCLPVRPKSAHWGVTASLQ